MRFLEAVLNTFWQGALTALLAWAAMRWMSRGARINAATRCAVWWAVLAVIVLLPLAHMDRPRGVRAPATELAAKLDQPWCKADLYFIEKLAATLRASAAGR